MKGRLRVREFGWPIAAAVASTLNLALGLRVWDSPTTRDVDALGLVLAFVAVAAIALRRRSPRVMVVLAVGVAAAYRFLEYPLHPGSLAVVGALYLAVRARIQVVPLVVVVVIAKIAVLVTIMPIAADAEPLERYGAFAALLTPLAPVVIAMLVNNHRDREAELEHRLVMAEQRKAAQTRSVLAEQRLAIARDLHDSLGHSLAVISVQSGAALHVVDTNPEAVRQALEIINDACRSVVAESKQSIARLRLPESGDAPKLDALLASAQASDLDVNVHVDGATEDLPNEVADTCRKVIQESITNTLRHAQARQISITWDVGDERNRAQADRVVSLAIRDDGTTSHTLPTGAGHGLEGMGERVRALGGELHAGPIDGGGFEVLATIPVDRAAKAFS